MGGIRRLTAGRQTLEEAAALEERHSMSSIVLRKTDHESKEKIDNLERFLQVEEADSEPFA